MGGSYGYGLGYVEGGRYHRLRNQHRATFALMADSPEQCTPESGHCYGPSHGQHGHNVLFEDGHVQTVQNVRLPESGDLIFQNGLGYVGAGIGRDGRQVGHQAVRLFRDGFHFVAQTEVQCQVRAHLPVILKVSRKYRSVIVMGLDGGDIRGAPRDMHDVLQKAWNIAKGGRAIFDERRV